MTDIGFYHLTRTTALDALPKLLGRTLGAGQRALVVSPRPDHLAALDAALWASTDPTWLPHGPADGPNPALHPILLAPACLEPANGARFLFLLDGALPSPGFDRIFDLFDGNDAAAGEQARQRWVAAKQAGHTRAYWQQEGQRWVKKA